MGRTTETSFRVRYAETDKMGVVHHSRYLVWLEEGRSSYLRQIGTSYADFEAETGFSLAVSEANARYILPARYDRLVTVRTSIGELHSRTMTFNYTVLDSETGRVLVEAFTRHVCIDRDGNVRRIPKAWQETFTGGQEVQRE